MPSLSKSYRTYLLLTSSALLWSTGYIAAKLVLDKLNPVTLAAARYAVAGLILSPVLAGGRFRALWGMGGGRPLLLAGIVVLPVQNILFLVGLDLTLASDASLIAAAGPAITALLARVALKERLTPNKLMGISLSFLGVALLIGLPSFEGRQGIHWLGDLLVLGSTTSWSVYTVLSGLALKRADPLQVTAITTLMASGVLLPIGILWWWLVGPRDLGPSTIATVAYMALAANVLATLWWVRGVSSLGAGRVSVFANLVPVATTLLSALFLKEELSVILGLSAVLVLGGVWLTNHKVN